MARISHMQSPTHFRGGTLLAIFLALKHACIADGLFPPEHKRPVTSVHWSNVVSVLTSGRSNEISLPDFIRIEDVPTNLFLNEWDRYQWGNHLSEYEPLTVTNGLLRLLTAPEARPAGEDPEGHWGPELHGYQLGLRLLGKVFTNGQPIKAVAILRNVSGRSVLRSVPDSDAVWFTVMRGNMDYRRGMAPTNPPPMGSKVIQMLPQTQRPLEIQLDRQIDLSKPGHYRVWAHSQVDFPPGHPPGFMALLYSSMVEFELIDTTK